jgi:putative flavoprotein involved in K+ transport
MPTVRSMSTERFDVVVIGGGQAGLATGYHLRRRGARFVILEAHARLGESWRRRWDTLEVFTPARNNGLPGMPFPGPGHSHATKDEVADFMELYARRMELPVRTGVHVDTLEAADGGGFAICAGPDRYEAGHPGVRLGAAR